VLTDPVTKELDVVWSSVCGMKRWWYGKNKDRPPCMINSDPPTEPKYIDLRYKTKPDLEMVWSK
jgi:hypothetical protein